MPQQIVAFQLLNDFSGSPMVLSLVAKGLLKQGNHLELYTSRSDQKGCLSDIEGMGLNYFLYKRSTSKPLTLFSLILGQLQLIFLLRKYRKTGAIFYINTLLPFGAAIAGKLYGNRVVFHLHETSIKPDLFKWFLFKIVKFCAADSIYVSKFLMETELVGGGLRHMVPNALHEEFVQTAMTSSPEYTKPFRILMVCSLKHYKGVNEFINLAKELPDHNFSLVLNASEREILNWRAGFHESKNLTILGPLKDLHPIYSTSQILLNLSHPDKWVETFGLTALEGMAYGLPVIVPECGGIAEFVNDGVEGFKCSVYDMAKLKEKILEILSTEATYRTFSENARRRSGEFDCTKMMHKIETILKFEEHMPRK